MYTVKWLCTATAGQVSHQKVTILLPSLQELLLHNYTEYLPVLFLCNFHRMRSITDFHPYIVLQNCRCTKIVFVLTKPNVLLTHNTDRTLIHKRRVTKSTQQVNTSLSSTITDQSTVQVMDMLKVYLLFEFSPNCEMTLPILIDPIVYMI